MRLLGTLLSSVVVALGCAAAPPLPTPDAPLAPLPTRTGGTQALAPSGRPLLVDFFASWCEPCKTALPHHALLAEKYRGRVDYVLVGLDEDPAALEAALDRAPGAAFTVALDPAGRSAEAFRVTAMPTAVLLRADGSEAWRGAPYTIEELQQALEGVK